MKLFDAYNDIQKNIFLWEKWLLKKGAFARLFLVFVDSIRVLWVRDIFIYGASMTYFTLMSIVPILFLLSSVVSRTTDLQSEYVENTILDFFSHYFLPEQGEALLSQLMQFVQNLGNSVSYLSFAVLSYSAYSLVYQLGNILKKIWKEKKSRPFWKQLIIDILILLTLPLIFFTGSYIGHFMDYWVHFFQNSPLFSENFPRFQMGLEKGVIWVSKLAVISAQMVALALFFVLIPSSKVRFFSGLFGAICTGVLMWFLNEGFALFFTYFGERYSLIYGAFASIILSTLWLYLFWNMLIYGICLSYAFQRRFLEQKRAL